MHRVRRPRRHRIAKPGVTCGMFKKFNLLSLLQKDGFVIPEAVIGNPDPGKIKKFWIPASAGMTTKLAKGSFCKRLV